VQVVEKLRTVDTTWHPKTVKTLLNRLVRKRVLAFEKAGRAYLYQHQVPHLAQQREPIRVGNQDMLFFVVQVAQRSSARSPTVFRLGPIAAPDVFAQAVHIVFGVSESNGEHELPLGIVFETEGGEAQIFECLLIEQIDDLPAVHRIAR